MRRNALKVRRTQRGTAYSIWVDGQFREIITAYRSTKDVRRYAEAKYHVKGTRLSIR